ncbi:MAG: SHD1 domain-containing protein [Pirellulaceae bacterium]
MRCLLTLVATCLAAAAAVAQEVRTWTSESGRFSVQAQLLDVAAESIRLKRADDGRTIDVPISAISSADRQYLQSFLQQQRERQQPPTTSTIDWKMPDPATLRVEQESKDRYQLHPFGSVSIPDADFAWRLVSRQPIVFVAQGDREQEMLVLTIASPAFSQDQRKARLKGAYSEAIHQVTGAGLQELKGSKIEFANSLADRARFTIRAASAEGNERLFLAEVQFHPAFTCIFQATAESTQRTAMLMKAAADFRSNDSLPDR